MHALKTAVYGRFGEVALLMNNAGTAPGGGPWEKIDRWRQVLDVAGCPQPVAREATAALAVHHEHRSRDLAAARTFAQLSLDAGMRPAWNNAVRHRLARIERKMTERGKTGYLYCD